MGLDPNILPEAFLRRMSAADRKPLGKAGRTQAECNAAALAKRERELQTQIENLLRLRDMFFLRPRMDKRTTIRKGWPDFTIIRWNGRALLVEAKAGEGRLSPDQERLHADYTRQTGDVVQVVRSLEEFIHVLDGPGLVQAAAAA